MNGERVKFMGHLGKSKESVLMEQGSLEISVGNKPRKMGRARWQGVLEVKSRAAVKGCTRT